MVLVLFHCLYIKRRVEGKEALKPLFSLQQTTVWQAYIFWYITQPQVSGSPITAEIREFQWQ